MGAGERAEVLRMRRASHSECSLSLILANGGIDQ
jgi:hypothetical protein